MDTTIKVKVDTSEAERALGRLNNAITALGAAFAGGSLIDFIDSATNLSNKLKLVTGSATELNKVTQQVIDISSQTGAEVNAVASLYSRLSQAQDTVGLTSAGVLRMTDLISKSLATSGLTVQETSSVMLQLSQAFNSGRLQGDEFRSIAEAYPPLLKMVAKEMGVTVGELKKLGSEGKITGVILRDAFLNNAVEIEKYFAEMARTLGQELNYIKNQAMKAFMEFDKATGISEGLAAALHFVGQNLDTIALAAGTFLAVLAVEKIIAATVAVGGLTGAVTALNAAMRANLIGILITALVVLGKLIYDAMIKPLIEAGVVGKTVALYIAESFINGFLNIGEAAIAIFPAIGKLIADSLTPGKDVSESIKEIQGIYKDILTQRRVQFVSQEEVDRMQNILQNRDKINTATRETGKLTKDVAQALTEEQQKALKHLTDYVFKLGLANKEEQNKLMYGDQYAKTQMVIAEQQAKLREVGLKLSEGQKQDLTNLVAQQFALKDIATTRQTLLNLADQITVLSEKDTRQQEIKQGLLQYERSVSKDTYEINKATVEQYIRRTQFLKDAATYANALKEIEQDTATASIINSREREIQSRLLQYQNQVSKEMFEGTKGEIELQLRNNQLMKDRVSIENQIRDANFDSQALLYGQGIDLKVNTQLATAFRDVNREANKDLYDRLQQALGHKAVQEEIISLMEQDRYLSLGTAQELNKLHKNREYIHLGIMQAQRVYNVLKQDEANLSKEEADKLLHAQVALTRMKQLDKTYELQQIAEIAKVTGDLHAQKIAEKNIELENIQNAADLQLLTAQQTAQAIAAVEKKYADEIAQYKIQKELETQGIRASMFGENVKLLSVDKQTAEQIAKDRVAFEKKTEFDKTQFFIQQSATVFDALGKQNREAFKAAQALNIAMALMNTYRAASVALATYPWPFSLVAVAAAVATGLAQVAAIRSQSYSGRALGGGVMGGASYIVGERGPELFTPTNSGKITRNQDLGTGGGTTVNFTVVANDTRGFDELLTARRGLITQIIQDAQLEKGRRI